MTDYGKSWPWWRWVLTGLSALALALSTYLSWHYLVGGSVIGCGGGSPCEEVLSSRWSSIGGVLPVSGLAAGVYLAMLVGSFFLGPATAAPDRRLAWGAMLVLAGAAGGSAVWFSIVQKWILGAFCPYCMATHVTGLLLAALVIWRAPLQFDHGSTEDVPTNSAPPGTRRRVIGALPAIVTAVVGLALAGILVACQVGFAPPAVYRGGESRDALSSIDSRAVPLVGSRDARYIVTLLFDYKCSHCQKIHSMLDEAIRHYDGKLAFALCPAPLNNQCNPYISQNVEEFKDSCKLAKVGLAVWMADREAFPAFDRWMFSREPEGGSQLWHPRSLDAVKAKAVELVGRAKFETARADPWIDRYLQDSIRIFGDTINPDQSGNAVPKLVFGSRWVTPEPRDASDLVLILQSSLALPKP